MHPYAQRSSDEGPCSYTFDSEQLSMHCVHCTSYRFLREASVPLLQGIVPWVGDSLPLFNRNRVTEEIFFMIYLHEGLVSMLKE